MNTSFNKKLFSALFVLSLLGFGVARAQTLPVDTGTGSGGTSAAAGGTGTSVELPNPLGIGTIGDLMNKIIDGLILFATPIVVAVVIWAAYLFISSRGEPDKITQARNALLYAILGYAILLLAKGIGVIISNFLSG